MELSGFVLNDSSYSQKCVSCGTLVCCETPQDLQKMFSTADGRLTKTCERCREKAKQRENSIRATKRTSYDLDEQFESYDDFIEIISSFMEQHDSHTFDADAHSLRFRATLGESFVIENDVSVGTCAQSNDQSLQKRAVKCFINDIFDCTGYYFHLRRSNERVDGPRFSLTCSRSNERRTGERDLSSVQRYTTLREFFECRGELHISFSKSVMRTTKGMHNDSGKVGGL
ncbi:hypothetical protein V1525DRAFT_415435 [Lipomyces kononenkoae]|uniref:Uncharacterized protein n=1 Tax=Lipomyces kononenkoae TaxID=34357 RepID=A0ACC3SQV8_LIPKO